MRMRACGWLLAGALACVPASASLRLEVAGEGLSTDEAAATQELVAQVLPRLPAAFREQLDRDIMLRWRRDLPGHVHGRTRGGGIGLQYGLLAAWMARDPAAGDADPSARAAIAAVLHELAHVHDRSPAGGLSSDSRLLDLAGWPERPLAFGLRSSRNDMRDRSPDAYELESPAEFVAVNFEHFLLDPRFSCRRPALHRYLAERLGEPPGTPPGCARELPFVGVEERDAALRLFDIDPERVQSVEYLLAEANEQPMSRWGHGMLRLVVCAPGRPLGGDCRLDLEHHVVLSFRAFVDDVQVSSWRGLTGSYPSRLFVLPLSQVVDEYTKVELRGLQSVPLRLEREEIASLVERASRVHWSYDGRYYFLSNNCAVETWKLLNDGVPRLSHEPLRAITPTGLLRRLVREGIADDSVLDDPAAAILEGYRFESLAAYFAEMYAIADTAMGLPVADAQDWLALDPVGRQPWLSRGDLRATAALLVLEHAALRREEAQAREALKQRFLRGDGGGTDEAAGYLRDLLADGAYAGRPALLLPGPGYGLPQAGERERLAAAVERGDLRLRALRGDLYRQAREWLPPARRARMEGTEANVALLGDRLRTMREAQAGDPETSPR